MCARKEIKNENYSGGEVRDIFNLGEVNLKSRLRP